MHKHRGFPSRLTGTDFHFTLRRESKSGATPLQSRKRYKDRKAADRKADEAFLEALIIHFGEEPFIRGNLDAGRLSWLFGEEVLPYDPEQFDPEDYDAELILNIEAIRRNFPQFIAEGT